MPEEEEDKKKDLPKKLHIIQGDSYVLRAGPLPAVHHVE